LVAGGLVTGRDFEIHNRQISEFSAMFAKLFV